ncbi:MAG: Uncharacterized protein XD61_0690 [Thermococcus sp. 40_45]|nr:MAG: Uncharacterized protein XD61_0690 [Thermococcus sp. 40_45]
MSSFGSAAVSGNKIPLPLAEKAARSYVNWIAANIPDFKEWENATLGEPVVYYFPNGEKSVYEFAVFKNGKNVGFILVSARKDMPPVLEFSKAEPPSWNLEKAKELAEKKGYKAGKLLYYGALTYGINIGNGKAIGLRDMKVRKYQCHLLQFLFGTRFMEFQRGHPQTQEMLIFSIQTMWVRTPIHGKSGMDVLQYQAQ